MFFKLLNARRADLSPVNWLGQYKYYRASNNAPQARPPANALPVIITASHVISAYAGKYYNAGYGTIKIVAQGDSLAGVFNKTILTITHKNYDIFEAKPGGRLVFQMNLNGEIESIAMPLEESVKPIVFTRIK